MLKQSIAYITTQFNTSSQ